MALRRLLAGAIAGLVLSCSGPGGDLPALPDVTLEDFSGQARRNVEAAQSRLADDPREPEANGRLGMILHAHEIYQAAEVCYERAAAFALDDHRWPYLRAVVQLKAGESEEGEASLRRSIAIRPYAPALVLLADELRGRGKLEESRGLYEDAMQLDRGAPAALFGLGQTLIDSGEPGEAIRLLRKAVAGAPSSGPVHYALAMAYRDAGDDENSELHLGYSKRLGQIRPGMADPLLHEVSSQRADKHFHLNEGIAAEADGRIDEAIAHYLAALSEDPDYSQAHVNLISAYGRKGNFDEADTHYRRAIELSPDVEELHNNWGVLEARRGRPAAAAEAFERWLAINPSSPDAHFNLGSMLNELGRRREAREQLERALVLDPGHRLANFQLGRYLVEQGQPKQAIPYLEKAVGDTLDEYTAGSLYGLADAYARAGDREAAARYARQALAAAEATGLEEMAEAIRRDLRSLVADVASR